MRARAAILALAAAAALAAPAAAAPTAATVPTGVVETVRKSMTYVPIRDAAGAGAGITRRIESAVRQNVEQTRFDINDLPGQLQGMSLSEIAAVTRQYVDEVKLGRAAATAEYDVRFKDLTITGEDLRRIAESAFLYVPTIGNWTVRHSVTWIRQNHGLIRVDLFTAEVVVPIDFYRLDFDTGEAVKAHTVIGRGRGEASSSPPFSTGSQAREAAIAEALDTLALDVRTKVRALAPFQLRINVERATGRGAYFPLTARDGLVPDALLRVEELTTAGDRITSGHLIVRDVGDGVTEAQSYGAYIHTKRGWTLTGGEMLFEVPQKGYMVSLEGFTGSLRIDPDTAGVLRAADRIHGGRLTVGRHLAEESGVHGLAVSARGAVGGAGDFIEVNVDVGGQLGWSYRRLFLSGGLRLGGLRAWTGQFASSAYVTSFGATGEARAWIWIVPQFTIELVGGYRAYIPVDGLTFGDSDFSTPVDGFRYNPTGWQAGGGFALRF